ncbi:hypothetical protein LCGC14_0741720 [marine sediment metagenome]|uniref:Uncharacterized protein n=1 Tax=marine sediment metagenome TaxID=412755 RepID=A0A0F9TDL2_9ZZZZ|nr:hypothetical protein [bacterium]
MKVNCEPQSIVDTFEAIDNNDDKLKYVTNILESCGVESTNETVKIKPKKAKRAMTGWLCYLKTCQRTGIPYSECMTDTNRKESRYIPKKGYWKDLAEKGCPE